MDRLDIQFRLKNYVIKILIVFLVINTYIGNPYKKCNSCKGTTSMLERV